MRLSTTLLSLTLAVTTLTGCPERESEKEDADKSDFAVESYELNDATDSSTEDTVGSEEENSEEKSDATIEESAEDSD